MESIKTWYMNTYPNDNLGNMINSEATFGGLINNMPSIYNYIGVIDSVIRQRVFTELASIRGVSYNCIYSMWLDQGKYKP